MTRIVTRLLPGARLVFPVLAACLAARAAFAAKADRPDPNGPGPLPWRVGGAIGFTVDAAAFPDSAGSVLEVYMRLAPATLMAVV